MKYSIQQEEQEKYLDFYPYLSLKAGNSPGGFLLLFSAEEREEKQQQACRKTGQIAKQKRSACTEVVLQPVQSVLDRKSVV